MAIIKKLPDVQEKFSDNFFKEIEVYNSEKPLTAPKALFLFAEYDFENLFNETETPTNFFILNIAKTHRVAIKIIQKINQIKPAIESIKFDGKSQPIDLLVFCAHGNDTCMQLSEKEIYSINDIKHSDFDGLSPDAEILLTSCKTGNGLAQKIADVTKHIVFAPKDTFIFLNTSFTFCDKHGLHEMRSYDAKHHPMAFRFQEGKSPVLCDESTPDYFNDLHEFLIKKSEQGDSDAQFYLAYIKQNAGNKAEAIEWYLKAAVLGNAKAQCNLGYIEEKAGNIDEAKIWFRKAAVQGHAPAQFNLAIIEEQAGNIDEAKIWYRKAAEQGVSSAQYNLGTLEQQAGKIDEAKEWYKQAAVQGHAKAQFYLGYFELKAGNIDKAKSWFKQAAEHYHPKAQFYLGYIEERADKGNIDEAKTWYRKAADQGQSDAQFYLGIIEQKAGKIDEAKALYKQAADQGHSNAQFYLGYIEEQLGNKDKAIGWYQKAAMRGNSEAQLKLKLI